MVKYIPLLVLVLLNVSFITSQGGKGLDPEKKENMLKHEMFNISTTESGEAGSLCKCPAPAMPGCISVYVGIALIVIILFMMLLISFLSYALYKTKTNIYKNTITTVAQTTIEKVDKYVRQDSTRDEEISTLRKITPFDSPFQRNGSTLNVLSGNDTIDKSNTYTNHDTVSTVELEPKVKLPIHKRNYPVQALILPDQMHKICKDVLSKMNRNESMSLTHLNELMNEERKDKSISKLSENYKCVSVPVIDDHMDMDENYVEYDVVPRRPLSSYSTNAEAINPVYDCIPHKNNIVISDTDGNYVMPMSSEGLFIEPSYTNAKVHKPSTSSSKDEEVIYQL